jgi:hypothetical protein
MPPFCDIWFQDPDLALFGCGFKDNKTLKSHVTVEIKIFLIFFAC